MSNYMTDVKPSTAGFKEENKDAICAAIREAAMDKEWNSYGWVDVYRNLYPTAESECYTWWSNRGQAWAKNVGWRIDYQIATPNVAKTAKSAFVYKEERFSDHAPLIIEYDF